MNTNNPQEEEEHQPFYSLHAYYMAIVIAMSDMSSLEDSFLEFMSSASQKDFRLTLADRTHLLSMVQEMANEISENDVSNGYDPEHTLGELLERFHCTRTDFLSAVYIIPINPVIPH